MIRFINVNKRSGNRTILKNINLEVDKGEVVVICGPSGAGKSTLLKTVNKLESIDDGEIIVDGMYISDPQTDLSKLRARIGIIFQHFNLYPHKTALKNITLAPVKVKGLSKKQAKERAMRLLEKVGMADEGNAYPAQLSGGQQQRVAIARSLALEPKIMLFDEPTSALNPELINEVLDVMVALAKEGMTMVVVTHEIGFAQKVADRIVFMDKGEIIETGSPPDIFVNPQHSSTKEFMSSVFHIPVFSNMDDED